MSWVGDGDRLTPAETGWSNPFFRALRDPLRQFVE